MTAEVHALANITVLLTLGRLPKSLALARALASVGCRVIVADPFRWHLCRPSRDVARCYRVRAPNDGLDAYLDDLSFVRNSGFLDEYVVDYFGEDRWSLPDDLDIERYRRWRRDELRGHRPETRIIGSWSYKRTAAD